MSSALPEVCVDPLFGSEVAIRRLLDIGRTGVPDAVLKKPGSLTVDEWVVMRSRPETGASLLAHSGIPLFDLAAEEAAGRHEKRDGSGYPHGLAGTRSPLPRGSWRSRTSSMRSRWTASTAREDINRRDVALEDLRDTGL